MQTRQPVGIFFGLTFLISGFAVAPLIAAQYGLAPFPVPPLLGLAAAIGPGIAAVTTVLLEGGRPAVWRLLRSALQWRVPFRWYAGVLLFAPLLLAATYALHAWLGAPLPSVSSRLPQVLPVFLFLMLQTGFGEELGWRGVAQPRLQTTLGLVRAALVVGVVWSFWHLPLFLIRDSMQWQLVRVAGAAAAVGGYSVYLVVTAILFALVMNASGSLLMPMILHGAINATAWLSMLNEVERQGLRPLLLLTVLEAVIVVAWLLGRRARGRSSSPPATRGVVPN
ncbi:MAG: CPBP family intramembrane glutamic endopeptidase [Acidobacteriota bacterium]